MKKFNIVKKKVTFKSVLKEIFKEPVPDWSRLGQHVSNRVHDLYGSIDKQIREEDKIDCFQRDDMIVPYIECVVKRLNRRYG